MSKGRKRLKPRAAAKAAGFGIPRGPRLPPPGRFCGVRPPPPMPFLRPMMQRPPFRSEPSEFMLREWYGHRPGFNMQEYEMHPRFPHPDRMGGPRGFHPEPDEGQHGFHPEECEGRPFRDEFMDGPPGFVPPEFQDGPGRFAPPEFRHGPTGFDPPEFRDDPPGRMGAPFQDRPGYPRKNSGCGPVNAMGLNRVQPVDFQNNVPCLPHLTQQSTQQSSVSANDKDDKDSDATTKDSSTSQKEMFVKRMLRTAKPPPGRSIGVITFISNSQGFIKDEYLKKYAFSFDAFFGHRNNLVPGVRVHFTGIKVKKKIVATDVKVAPGGTEDIDDKIYEGVVTTVLPDTYALEPHPGRIRTILTTDPVKLPFGKMDSKATLLLYDRVKFQLITNIVTNVRRATNITPQIPETFQLTKEIREKGITMCIKDDTATILSKKHEDLTASLCEYLSEDELKIMDEVEFTVVNVKDKVKAIRLEKLPEGSVEFDSEEKKDGEQLLQGLVDTTIDDTQKSLPVGSDDVITKDTIMVSDKVHFNIATKQQTKEERAVNIEVQPQTFQLDSTEERKLKKMTIKSIKDPTPDKKEDTDCNLLTAENLVGGDVEMANTLKQDNKSEHEINQCRSQESSGHRSHSQARSGSHHAKHRSSSRDRSYHRYRRSRSHSRDRSRRYRHSYSRSRSRERSRRGGRKRSYSQEYEEDHRGGKSYNKEISNKRQSRSPDGQYKGSKYAANLPSTETVNYELVRKRKELLELNELIARQKAIIAMKQNTNTPSYLKDALEFDLHEITTFDYRHKTFLETADITNVNSILKYSESLTDPQHQMSERSESQGEPMGCTETNIPSIYMSAGLDPIWLNQSSSPEIKDQEFERKKRQLEELSECVARKKAIMAMEQKAKGLCDGSEITKKYDFLSFGNGQDRMANKNTWQLDTKPDLQPKKSILKKPSESVNNQPQKHLTSVSQYTHFPMSIEPKDDHSVFLSSSGPSDIAFENPCNPPSALSNRVDFFKKLINQTSISSSMKGSKAVGQQSFQPSSGLFYNPINTIEGKNQSYSTLPTQISQSFLQACTNEGSSTPCSASKQKSNLATQMERFLGALNKADSNLLSSLLRGAKKNSDPLENRRISQQQLGGKLSSGDELYDPFKETDCSDDDNPLLGNINNMIQDNRLPHERAEVDGSGFSKIVGMKYGAEAKPENQFFYGAQIPSTSQSRLLEEHEKFLKECAKFKVSQDSNSGRQYSYVEDRDREKYEAQRLSERYKVQSRLGEVHQKPEDVNQDVDQKTTQNKTIQNLLQTIGLNLDTAEVSKLTDRTKERLYGKKVKSQPLESLDKKNKHSASGYDRKRSSHSSDSEDVDSGSPAKTSNREVYMSYLDSIKYRHNAGAFEEQDLFSLKRTIKNSPEAKQMSPNPYEIASAEAPDEADKPRGETSSSAQSVGYAIDEEQNSYRSIYLNPLRYNTGYSTPPINLPSGYGTCTTASSMMPPSPSQFFPAHSTFTSLGSYDPSLPPPYPPTSAQFGFNLQPGISGYATQQTTTRSTVHNRCLKTIETVQTQKSVSNNSAAKKVCTVISIKREKGTQSEVETQKATTMEDDIKAKQKKRLEQFNQRMRLKKAQQMESQRGRPQNQDSVPGNVSWTEVKNVWICGHSLVFWAEKRATSPEIGMQLGMAPNSVRIWWKGVQGMIWEQLLPQLLQLKDNWPKPDVIVIHLGGNDIGKMTPETFVLTVKKDLISMKSIFPQCHLVWSDILPRMSWRHSDDSTAVNNMRQAINKTIRGIIAELGGSSLTHDNIVPRLDNSLYRPDGVHLSGKGIDTFNLNMQDFLEKWESETSETETCEISKDFTCS